MEVKACDISASYDYYGRLQATITIDKSCTAAFKEQYDELKQKISCGKKLDISIKTHREKRSLDANDYCWVLCDKIAEKINSTKEDVYRQAIRAVGVFEQLPVRDDAVERWIETWQSRGVGWIAEVVDKSKLDGYTKVFNYYGSSCYDSKEMSRLIDWIVDEAKQLGIETMTPQEMEILKGAWK